MKAVIGLTASMIEDAVQHWLNAAEDIEALLPRLSLYDRHVWADRAKAFRNRAYEFEQLLSNIREQSVTVQKRHA